MYTQEYIPEDDFIASFRKEEKNTTLSTAPRENDEAFYYLQEIARTPLLTVERERELFRSFDENQQQLVDLFDDLPRSIAEKLPTFKKSSLIEILPLLERIENTFKEIVQHSNLWTRINEKITRLENIRSQIIEANLLLVASIAKQHNSENAYTPSLTFLDLMQEGSIGLMKATEKFETARGYRFSTYATWWIMQGIKRALDQQSKTIRTPSYAKDAIRSINQTRNQLIQELQREPTLQELSEETELSEKRIIEMINSAKDTVSLSVPIDEKSDDDSDRSYADLIADDSQMTPEQETFENSTKESIESLLRKLTGREALVIKLRYGVADGDECTLNEIGNRLNISRERIRQIEKDALAKLKRVTYSVNLEDLL